MATSATLRIHALPTPAQELTAAIDAFNSYGKAKNLSGETLEFHGDRLKAFRNFLADHDGDVAPADITPAPAA